MGSQVLSPKYDDVDAHMATLFGGVAWGLMLRVGLSRKLEPTLNTSHVNIFE